MRLLPLSIASAAASALLASELDFAEPTLLDRRVRRLARAPSFDAARGLLKPLFPVGLPGGYIPLAYATAHWLHRRRRHGGPGIVTAAWPRLLVQPAVKVRHP